jgi:mannose/cellobiose epimerase-like protein (N-acyl-D-glucosamine 2-epimerase family)
MPLDSPSSTRDWLLEHICPYWLARVVDPDGGFFESLDRDGRANKSVPKTVLNQARLTYVFSHAALLGGDETMRAAADHGFEFLRRVRAAAGPLQGWPRSIDVRGMALDPVRDSYDQAFVLFAMAWYHRASATQEALRMADQTCDFLERHVADPVHGGFFEEYPAVDKLPRRQNPHMHLLEAMLAMHAASGKERWLQRAGKLAALFRSRFLDPRTGALVEYFNADWSIADGSAGMVREPGHQFEWVWLLDQYMRQAPQADLTACILRLFEFASRHGIDSAGPLQGVAFDAVDAEGAVLVTSKLFWPQTEAMKACIALFERTGDDTYQRRAKAHLELLRTHFFHSDGANWTNHLSRDGAPLVADTPARVLYHLFLSVAELIRIEEA